MNATTIISAYLRPLRRHLWRVGGFGRTLPRLNTNLSTHMRQETQLRFSQIIRIRNNPKRPDAGTPEQYHASILTTLREFQELPPTEYTKPPGWHAPLVRFLAAITTVLLTVGAFIGLGFLPAVEGNEPARWVLTAGIWFLAAGTTTSWRDFVMLVTPTRPWMVRRALIFATLGVFLSVGVAGVLPPELWMPHARILILIVLASVAWVGVLSGRGAGWLLTDPDEKGS